MPLNVDRLRQSFAKAKPIAGKVADKFYEVLWERYPEAQPLFAEVKMPQQKKALIGSLSHIVDNLENSESLIKYLKDLGQRHVSYGAQPQHYKWVGESLLDAFAQCLGEHWTQDDHEAWAEAYETMAVTMLEGAEEAEPSKELIRAKAQHIANKLLMQVLEDSFDEQMVEMVRARLRKVIFEVLEEEAGSLLFKKTV